MPRKYKSPSPSPRHSSKKYKTTPTPTHRKRVRSLSRDRNDRTRKIVKKKGYKNIRHDSEDELSESDNSSSSDNYSDSDDYSSSSSSSDSEDERQYRRGNNLKKQLKEKRVTKNKHYTDDENDDDDVDEVEMVPRNQKKQRNVNIEHKKIYKNNSDENVSKKQHSENHSSYKRNIMKNQDTENEDDDTNDTNDIENEHPKNLRQRRNITKDNETAQMNGPPKYRVVSFNGEELAIRKMYTSNIGPKNAAQKAFNKMCDKLNERMEITVERMGDNKGKIMTYFFMKQELDPPIEREIAGKKVVYRHKTVSC